jgi:hypothetical protein
MAVLIADDIQLLASLDDATKWTAQKKLLRGPVQAPLLSPNSHEGVPGRRSNRANDGHGQVFQETDVRWHLIRLSQPLVPKVAMTGTLHDGLRARELYVGTKSLSGSEVRTADQQESELRLTQLLVELSVPTSRNVDLESIL